MKHVIIVTGGSWGIGRAICMAFAGEDTRIFFNYLSSDRQSELTKENIRNVGIAKAPLFPRMKTENWDSAPGLPSARWYSRKAAGLVNSPEIPSNMSRKGLLMTS